MAISQIRNVFDTSKYESGIKKLDVREMIFQLQPDSTPFLTVLGKMSKAKCVDTEFSWFEDDLLGQYTQINHADYGAGDTSLVVDTDTTGIFQVNDILLVVGTGEKILVTVIVDSTHTLTVVRAFGTTVAGAIVDNEYLYKLGSTQEEGYTTPEGLVTAKTKKANYVQIFSKAVEFTETADKIATYGGNRRNFERNKKAVELKRDIESQFLWGEPKEITSGTHPQRATGGIYYFLGTTAPTLDMSSAALTESAFESFLKDVFTYSEKDRIFFCGPLINSQISQFAAGKQRLEPGSTVKYGIKVRTYHSANGDVDLALDRHFTGPHAGKGLVLDPSQMVYRYLQESDFTLDLNIQPKNSHKKLDEYSATIGLEMHQAKLHGIVKGVV